MSAQPGTGRGRLKAVVSVSDRTGREPDQDPGGLLSHVVVAGGTPWEWAQMTTQQWRTRLEVLAAGGAAGGAHWVTLLPHGGDALGDSVSAAMFEALDATGKVESSERWRPSRRASRRDDGLTVIVDPSPDGHARFADAVAALCASGAVEVDEAMISRTILEPAGDEPDLVVVLGRPDALPTSLVWELAYSELVFLDLAWESLNAGHLESAIDDFSRRHRRFGGLDS